MIYKNIIIYSILRNIIYILLSLLINKFYIIILYDLFRLNKLKLYNFKMV